MTIPSFLAHHRLPPPSRKTLSQALRPPSETAQRASRRVSRAYSGGGPICGIAQRRRRGRVPPRLPCCAELSDATGCGRDEWLRFRRREGGASQVRPRRLDVLPLRRPGGSDSLSHASRTRKLTRVCATQMCTLRLTMRLCTSDAEPCPRRAAADVRSRMQHLP